MAASHGKDTFISINGADISQFCTDSELTRGADEHDLTGYGKQAHVVRGGLGNGKASVKGWYDNTAGSGPRAVLRPLVGTNVTMIRRPEGTGSGKPQDSATVHVKEYVETNPVADYIAWSVGLTVSDVITSTTQ